MIKRILKYLIAVLAVFIVAYFSHDYILNKNDLYPRFSLFYIYIFHVIASTLVYVIIELIAYRLPQQAGYGFLALVFIKAGFFMLIFKGVLFTESSLNKFEKISLIIPLLLYLFLETFAIAKLLNSNRFNTL